MLKRRSQGRQLSENVFIETYFTIIRSRRTFHAAQNAAILLLLSISSMGAEALETFKATKQYCSYRPVTLRRSIILTSALRELAAFQDVGNRSGHMQKRVANYWKAIPQNDLTTESYVKTVFSFGGPIQIKR